MEISLFGRQYFINKVLLMVIIIFLVFGSGLLGYFLKQVYHPLSEPVIEEAEATKNVVAAEAENGELLENQKIPEKIRVYIVGCVAQPGVVTIDKGSVIDDAIRMAGGATKEADIENINLAYVLNENTMLRIKAKVTASASGSKVNNTSSPKQDGKSEKQVGASISSGGKTSEPVRMNSGVDIISDSLDTVVSSEQENAEGQGKSKLVNINKATLAELEGLPNVGPATAKAIIEYREKNGDFKKLTDLMKITGIKQKTFDKIKDYICV